MLINLRDKNKKLVIKDYLDIDFDMSVEKEGNKYYVAVNHKYRLDEEFRSEEAAEKGMLEIARARNTLENELREY